MDQPEPDEPERICELCSIKYHKEFGKSCGICNIWICMECWPDHIHKFMC